MEDNSKGTVWEENYEKLVEFVEENGHCVVSRRSNGKKGDCKLANWVSEQRRQNKNGKLSADRKRKLNSLNFVWDTKQQKPKEVPRSSPTSDAGEEQEHSAAEDTRQWDHMLSKLVYYKSQHGHCAVPLDYPEDPALARWVQKQRSQFHAWDTLKARKDILDTIDFDWSPAPQQPDSDRVHDAEWDQNFQKLSDYHRKNGHTRIPWGRRDSLDNLALWVVEQRRRRYSSNRHVVRPMSQSEIDRLDSIGFIWNEKDRDDSWNSNFDRLKKYKREHGHCNVPTTYKADNQLGQWVAQQRYKYSYNQLPTDRIRRLEEIGFSWRLNDRNDNRDIHCLDSQWQTRYQELRTFHQEHGHSRVPTHDGGPLGYWVELQRQRIKNKTITREQKGLLDKINFGTTELDHTEENSSPPQQQWDIVFQRLLQFKKKHNHCSVPISFKDKSLGRWVSKQRTFFRRGTLPEDRRKRLDDIGFSWDARNRRNEGQDAKESSDETSAWEPDDLDNLDSDPDSNDSESESESEHSGADTSWAQSGIADEPKNMPFRSSDKVQALATRRRKHTQPDLSERNSAQMESRKRSRATSGLEANLHADELDTAVAISTKKRKRLGINKNNADQLLVVERQAESESKTKNKKKEKKRFAREATALAEREAVATRASVPARTLQGRHRPLLPAPKPDVLSCPPKALLASKNTRKYEQQWKNVRKGGRVAVYWGEEGAFFDGIVKQKNDRKGQIFVVYDDGDEEWVDPKETTIRVLEPEDDPDEGNSEPEKLNAKARELVVGSKISILWPAEKAYFDGTVSMIVHGSQKPHFVEYDDGDSQWLDLSCCTFLVYGSAADLNVGSRVSVWWDGDEKYFDGKVTNIKRDKGKSAKPHFVEYDDGDKEWTNLFFRKFLNK